MAGPVEADGAGVGQGRDEMVGGVVAVEAAAAAMDDQGRVIDLLAAGRARPGGPGSPRPSPSPPASLRANSALAQSAIARRSGATGWAKMPWPALAREALEIVADRDAARLAGLGREAEIPFGVVAHPRGHVDDDRAGEARRRRGRTGRARARSRPATSRPRSRRRRSSASASSETSAASCSTRRPLAGPGRGAVAAQIDRDRPGNRRRDRPGRERSRHAPSARAAARAACPRPRRDRRFASRPKP